jgi:L-seryl-tRNA(Ser) seleniumtransferase
MKKRPEPTKNNERLRALPSVDECLKEVSETEAAKRLGKRRTADLVREAIAETRRAVLSGEDLGDIPHEVSERFSRLAEKSLSRGLRKVLNATGVILHTNLGRAPLSDDAREAILNAASYCTLEYDPQIGGRGPRAPLAERLIAELTGAEDALIVNNCAAAAYLVLKNFAEGGEVVISRGELVEIGGDFRVPEILAASGAEMREVGTTNRTSIDDYRDAIGERTRLILRVHPSNYRVVGFTEQAEIGELAALAAERSLVLFEDIGSGLVVPLGDALGDEPTPRASMEAGVDIAAFSGDKLLGGPQAGILVGKSGYIAELRSHPLYRALRPDKLIYAALEATLLAYDRGSERADIPVLKMISESSESLDVRTRGLVDAIREKSEGLGFRIEIRKGSSTTGGGTSPLSRLATHIVAITHEERSPDAIARLLRTGEVPVIARIEDDAVCLDLRTIENDEELAEALLKALASTA